MDQSDTSLAHNCLRMSFGVEIAQTDISPSSMIRSFTYHHGTQIPLWLSSMNTERITSMEVTRPSSAEIALVLGALPSDSIAAGPHQQRPTLSCINVSSRRSD